MRYYNHLIEESDLENVNMFAITPDTPNPAVSNDDLNYTVLSDVRNEFARKLNLVFKPALLFRLIYKFGGADYKKTQDNRESELPIPATYAFVEEDYTKRAEPSAVLDEYRKLLKK